MQDGSLFDRNFELMPNKGITTAIHDNLRHHQRRETCAQELAHIGEPSIDLEYPTPKGNPAPVQAPFQRPARKRSRH
eukprot:9466569-Pyramimonas_sp.AAC.1